MQSSSAARPTWASIANGDSPFNPLTLVEGNWPGNGDVVIELDRRQGGIKVGDTIGIIQGVGPVQNLRTSGIVKFGSVSTIGARRSRASTS